MPSLRIPRTARARLVSPLIAVALAVAVLGATGAALAQADTVTPVPNLVPFGSAVSCADAAKQNCVAVGENEKSEFGGDSRLVQITGGVVGKPEKLPAGFNAAGVACPSATSCLITGNLKLEGVVVPVTNGVIGSPQPVPGTRSLGGIACPDGSSCVAVGFGISAHAVPPQSPQSGVIVPISHGIPGTPVAVPGVNGTLNAVACSTATSCTAVGVGEVLSSCGEHCTNAESVAEVVPITGGSPGTVQQIAGTPGHLSLSDVACPAGSNRCVVVGGNGSSVVTVPISGGVAGAPVPSTMRGGLRGISCPTASGCIAVGGTGIGAASGTIVPVSLDGAVGAHRSEPGTTSLTSIDCADLSTCIAVGTTDGYTSVDGRDPANPTIGAVVEIGGGPPAPTPGQITAALSKSLGVSGAAAKIAAIIKAGAYPAKITVPGAGTASIAWYYVPKGATVARAKAKPKPVLIASGTKTFAKQGKATLKVKLTKKGKAMLRKVKKGHKLGLTAKGSFTPKGGKKATSKKKAISLKR